MKIKNILSLSVVAILLAVTLQTAFALPTISSQYDQTFEKNQEPAQLHDITVTEDSEDGYIRAGFIKITIPDTQAMNFDADRTSDEILVYGSAVDSGKVLEKPEVTFENQDRTLIIPIEEDFALGEQIVITKTYVKGFHETSVVSGKLALEINNDSEEYLDNRTKYTDEREAPATPWEDVYKPNTPTNIAVEDHENGVIITWNDSTDLDLQSIHILRGKNDAPISGIAYVEIAPETEEYIDTDVVEGDTVKYILKASDGINFSDLTEEISFVVGSTLEEPAEEPAEEPEEEEPAEDPEEDEYCSLEYVPVCGTDGITYTNACTAGINNVEIAHEGECETVEAPFEDIADHWAQAEIIALAEEGIVTGQSATTFNPDGNLNRAEATALIYRILYTQEPQTPTQPPFPDVPVDEWYAGYISELSALSLINGHADGTFKPSDNITRAEFFTLALNLYYHLADETTKIEIDDLKSGPATDLYSDLENDWYTPTITTLTELGFISGSQCGNEKCVYANEEITRAEAVIPLHKMFSIN